jgi:RNA polymerase sigma-70 factor (ECF subfamily)
MPATPVPSTDDDDALLAAAAAGDAEAFGTLYARYQHVVYRFALAMAGTTDAAEDVTQDVFLALLDDGCGFDGSRARFSTYLYGIVRNLCRRRLRRLSRAHTLRLEAGEHELAPGGRFVDHLADAERAASVRRALTRIPSRYREVIVLCDLHDLSYADAAAVIRASVPAVRSRLHRGRHLLRHELSAHVAPAPHPLRPARCAP